jgi:hypothetical protein
MQCKAEPLQPPFLAVFVAPTTTPDPTIPKGARMLGHVVGTRREALQEAIEYLRAEMVVSDLDAINGKVVKQ